MQGHAAAQIRQGEGRGAVAPVGRADQLKQGRILGNRYQGPVTESPVQRHERPREHPDFTDEWLTHDLVPPFSFFSRSAPAGLIASTFWFDNLKANARRASENFNSQRKRL